MHHSRRKSRRFVYRTGGFIVLLWAAHGSIFHFAVPEGDKTARRRAAGEQHEAAVRSGADQLAQGVPVVLVLHILQVVEQQNAPPAVGRREREALVTGGQVQNILPAQQSLGERGLTEAAGGAEKENAPSGHEALKAFRDGGFNDDLRLVSSSVKHNGMVLSRIAPLYTLKRKCKSYRSMRKRTKRRRSIHFFLTG